MSNPNGPWDSPDFAAPSSAHGQSRIGPGPYAGASSQPSVGTQNPDAGNTYIPPSNSQPRYHAGPLSPPQVISNYAPWGQRFIAMFIDLLPTYLAVIVFAVGYVLFLLEVSAGRGSDPLPTIGVAPMIIGFGMSLPALGWTIYNRWLVAGRTGQSWGKRVTKITLISEQTGQPIGPLNAFLRDLVHILDGVAYVGYLWPLWDDKKQTFADMLMKTIVVRAQPVNPNRDVSTRLALNDGSLPGVSVVRRSDPYGSQADYHRSTDEKEQGGDQDNGDAAFRQVHGCG